MRDNTQSNVVTTLAANLVGATGATGATGAPGGTPWILTNYQGITGPGYTGTGYTGDVMIFGSLYVRDGIDPTYLALTPQPSTFNLPTGLDGIWIENGGALRTKAIYLDNDSEGPASINLDPTNTTQLILSDGLTNTTSISGGSGIEISDSSTLTHKFSASSTNIILPSLDTLPAGATGMIVFQGGRFQGYNGIEWKFLDN
jgi:hypothetical protein